MQVIDIEVSRRKFRRELDTFKSIEHINRKRGIFLLSSEYPNLIFSFAATKLRPAPIVFAVCINFDNYDLQAPSVRFVNPFTLENWPLLPTLLPRKIANAPNITIQHLAQKDDTGLPFICFPGVREYHLHPAHTGDHWLLHRGRDGVGTLGFIIEKLYEYGISAITSYRLVAQSPVVQIMYDLNLIPS